jgi:hypothetical protein
MAKVGEAELRRRYVMAQWEYMHERIERPLEAEGRDIASETLSQMNRLGADGWEVCSILMDDQQSWIVLLKREAPMMGMGALGAKRGFYGKVYLHGTP